MQVIESTLNCKKEFNINSNPIKICNNVSAFIKHKIREKFTLRNIDEKVFK